MMMQLHYMLGSKEYVNNDALNIFLSSQTESFPNIYTPKKLHTHLGNVYVSVCILNNWT